MDVIKLCCSICLDLLKDPVTIPVDKQHCMDCIEQPLGLKENQKHGDLVLRVHGREELPGAQISVICILCAMDEHKGMNRLSLERRKRRQKTRIWSGRHYGGGGRNDSRGTDTVQDVSRKDMISGSEMNKSWCFGVVLNNSMGSDIKVNICDFSPGPARVGVYLDHSAGVMAFYSVSETMTLLHRVHTTFTEPLCPGFGVFAFFGNGSAEFSKLE
ncbi:fibronectin type III and SPRY domain-containing protein 1-like [Notothenia coriiceps]|uniref:Fibronectin type III and SPRY domain-containing protein 1-like n=1 Tax=Notothenia coriiceps TaxID=8208 RepID=A0A6I9PUB2_9TELE|nr:PREDICTED: fibronectin type III and SPRY domain-containing protein 1-like [Notothenia coriiceps]